MAHFLSAIESVPDILEREIPAVIQDWLARVEQESDLASIPLTFEERTGHLPQLLRDVIARCVRTKGRKPDLKSCSHPRRLATQTRLHRRHGGGGIWSPPSQHFFDAAQRREAFGLQYAASRRCNHRGRSGCAVEATHVVLHDRLGRSGLSLPFNGLRRNKLPIGVRFVA
jgi:hypothetical protein